MITVRTVRELRAALRPYRGSGSVALVQGDPVLDKVTYPSDFALAEARAGATWRTRTATGFDVHRLEDGEELWLRAVVLSEDGGLSVRMSTTGPVAEAERIGTRLASDMLDEGAADLMEAPPVRNQHA